MGKLPLLNPLSKSACGFFFALIDGLKLIWGFVIKCAVWPLGIVEFDVRSDTFHKLLLRFVLCSIDLFPFHGREKGLHDGIVVGLTRFRKRLDNLVHSKQLAECF